MITVKTLERSKNKIVQEISKQYHVTVDKVEISAEPGGDGNKVDAVRMCNGTTDVLARFVNDNRIDIIVKGQKLAEQRELRWCFHSYKVIRVSGLTKVFGYCFSKY